MRWVVMPGTCSSDCTYDPTNVQSQQCEVVPEEVCTQQPQQVCDGVQPLCQLVHKKIPVRDSKKVPKRVCGGDGNSGNNFNFGEKKLFLINKLKHKLGHKLGLGGGHGNF